MNQNFEPGTTYGVPTSEWAKLDRDGMQRAKRDHEETQRQTRRSAVVAFDDRLRADRESKAEAARAERDAEQVERLKRDLRRGFFAADPSATEEQFDAALPRLLATKREQNALDQVDSTRRALRRRIKI